MNEQNENKGNFFESFFIIFIFFTILIVISIPVLYILGAFSYHPVIQSNNTQNLFKTDVETMVTVTKNLFVAKNIRGETLLQIRENPTFSRENAEAWQNSPVKTFYVTAGNGCKTTQSATSTVITCKEKDTENTKFTVKDRNPGTTTMFIGDENFYSSTNLDNYLPYK